MTMLSFRNNFTLFLTLHLCGLAAPTEIPPLQFDDPEAFHVAIVGAGIAGAASAFYLHDLSISKFGKPIKVTIYESSSEVGGQVRTIFPPTSRYAALESGASNFFEDDWCLVNAAHSLDLELKAIYSTRYTQIWNGFELSDDHFCFKRAPWTIPPFWDPRPFARREVRNAVTRLLSVLRYEWEHKFTPWDLRRELLALQKKLASFGENGTFDNIYRELDKLGLGDIASISAKQLLSNLGVPESLQENSLEPCIRNSFGMNLEQSSGLHAVASLASTRSQPLTIRSGNSDLVRRMIEKSGAHLSLNSQIVQIDVGFHRRFALTVASQPTGRNKIEYDAVIFTGDSLNQIRPQSTPRSDSFQSHVTHFSTYKQPNLEVIGLEFCWTSLSVLTTENSTHVNKKADITRITPLLEFYIDHTDCSPDDECDQAVDVYQVDSHQPLSRETIRKMARDAPANWIHSQSWNRRRFVRSENDSAPGNVELEPNLFNVDNNFLDTMETSCRMGRNIALKLHEQKLWPESLEHESDGTLSFERMKGIV